MSNAAYNRGAQREREWVRKLRESGWFAVRTAGSHSPCDVVACKRGEIAFYQLKSGRRRWPARDERFALSVEAERAGAVPYIVFWEPGKPPERVPKSEWPA